ncbi:hypothetical protein A2348_02735 [Candidatus Uhrbacteria bacterium RIFOXYB12_FULL_58_10]|uniref:Alpha/beta hydrolase n=1 Tax=Candidatus Uhrbacteria bacterium RIFOXYB2_FULL_57_15 TaxID=1802422 RepID=A0A1F7W6M1_9BACT|nr:MAG: hypothetical protein A2348_02735 [Candidatus Uhrbacteria bacterium RIFOXYB12_FULL_58_10]OGL98473.1 MAG: hypothetical protein A2304_02155 [Candidatus Uhrbacteria bacterium RIFOXYB2_FULL_57_15]OGL99212.1 MAG: hypothetical protein A2501_03380 [Candidatus Uhrbacteria bacterium RIFOXYC12_FULL_57_11]
MKRAFVIHGWDGTPDHGFFPWLRDESEAIVRERLGGKTVIAHGRGHFSGDDGCVDLHEIIEFI